MLSHYFHIFFCLDWSSASFLRVWDFCGQVAHFVYTCVAPGAHGTRQSMTNSKIITRSIGAWGRTCSTGSFTSCWRPHWPWSSSPIPGAGQQHTARCRMCLPLFRAVSLCCGCDHSHVCMHTQTEIKPEFSEFFDKMFENNGAWCQLPSCSIRNRSQTCQL